MVGLSICGEEESLITRNNGRPLFKKPRTEGPLPIICSSRKALHPAVEEQLPLDEDLSGDNESTHEEEADLVLSASHSGEESSSEGRDEGTDGEAENEEENEDEDDEEKEEEEAGNGNSSPIGSGAGTKSVLVTLTDTDVLDCSICVEPLSSPIYQCSNGHIACASCYIKMSRKCGSCSCPIGYYRCRAMEKVVESIKISCQNTQHGCKEILFYSKKLDHEKTCNYAPCSCPHPACDYFGTSDCLYAHFATQHSNSSEKFVFNSVISLSLDSDQKHIFLQERTESSLLQRSIDPLGSFVNVICVAPTSSKNNFSYDITARDEESSINLKAYPQFTPKWTSSQAPAKKFLLIPSDFSVLGRRLRLELIIRRK